MQYMCRTSFKTVADGSLVPVATATSDCERYLVESGGFGYATDDLDNPGSQTKLQEAHRQQVAT